MVYSTCPLISRVESATILWPFLSWMVSAHAAQAAQPATKQQNVMIRRTLKNCSNSVRSRKPACYSKVTMVLLAGLALGAPCLAAQSANQPASQTLTQPATQAE